jgi:TP901 family phage tail tape measure protein
MYNVSWLFKIVNKYSSEAKRISADSIKISQSTRKSANAIGRKNTVLRQYQASLLKTKRRLRDYRYESKLSEKASSKLLGKFKQLAAGALVAVGITSLVRAGAAVEDSIADLSAITGAGGKDLQFYTKEINNLALAAKTMPAEVGNAFKAVASAKSELLKDPKALSVVTEQVLLLKNASGIETDASSKVLTESLNQFNAGADQAARFVNVLAAGSKVGASEVNETGVAVVKSGVAAKLAKVQFEELNAMIQVLAKNGIKAEVAGTGLQNVLLKLETSGIKQITPSIVGIGNALEALKSKSLTAKQQEQLFGLEGLKAGSILIENAQLMKDWTKEITGTSIAQEQASKRMATFNSGLKGTRVRLAVLASSIFNVARPALMSLGATVDDFVDSMSDASDVEFFGMLLGGLATSASLVGQAFSFLGNLIVDVLKPPMAILKFIGTFIGQIAAAIATLDFSNFDLSGSLTLGDKFLGNSYFDNQYKAIAGFFGGGKDNASADVSPVSKINDSVVANGGQNSVQGEIVVKASKGTEVESVSANTSGKKSVLRIGTGVAGVF